MNELIAAANVAMIVRREVDEDYVGLWVIPWHVRRSVVRASDDRVREISVAALTALLQDGVLIGDLDGNTGQFTPWSTDRPVAKVVADWRELGRDPNIGEIAWLARSRTTA